MANYKYEKLIEMWKDLKLTPQQISFVYHYCTNDMQDAQAACDASGYKSPPAVLFNKPKIKEAISIYMNTVLSRKKNEILQKQIDVLEKRAFYDPAMFVDKQGRAVFNKLEDVPKEWRVVIDGIKEDYKGRDADRQTVEFKLADRNKALDQLNKLLELVNDVVEIKGMNNIQKEQEYVFNITVRDTTNDNPLKAEMEKIINEED